MSASGVSATGLRISKEAPSCKPTTFSKCGNVARSVNDADDQHRIRVRHVVDSVGAMKRDAKSRRERLARGAGERKMSQFLAGRFNRADKPRCNVLRCFGRQGSPNFSQISFGRIG